MLAFVVEVLDEERAVCAGTVFADRCELLLACGQAALSVDRCLKKTGRIELTPEERGEFHVNLLRHISLFVRAGGKLIPKHHMMVHAVARSGAAGARLSAFAAAHVLMDGVRA